jgi:hypothetical protein
MFYNCRRRLFHANNYFSLFYNFYICYLFHHRLILQQHSLIFTMDDRLSKPKRKLAKSAQPSLEEKEAMTAELEKARLKDKRPVVQPTPLEPPPHFHPPVEDLGTAAPPLSTHPIGASASAVDPDGYNFGDRYGGYQATRFNSTLLDDRESDARAEYNFHATRRISSAPGFLASFTTPFHDPNAYGQGHRASSAAPQGESPAPQALNQMQKILESIERATSASSHSIQSFFSQGELILVYLVSFKFLGFS